MGHQISIFLHLHASSSPSPSGLGILGWGFPNPPWSASSLSLSLAPSPGPQFTPDPRRGPKSRSPRARSDASGTHARTWRARAGSGRAGSGERNSRVRQATARPAWKLCSVNLTPARGGARPAAPAPGPAVSPGPRRPLPRGEGHASQERCVGELPVLLRRPPETRGAMWPLTGYFRD